MKLTYRELLALSAREEEKYIATGNKWHEAKARNYLNLAIAADRS